MDNCIFCKIVKGEIPAFKIWENEEFLAFLTIAPINPGHTLMVPKKHYDDIFEIKDETLGKLLQVCKPVAKALLGAFQPKTGKIGLMVAGLEVSHPHIHLIPMDSEGDLNFAKAKKVSLEELQENAEKIKQYL